MRFHAEQHLPMPIDTTVLDFHPVGIVETPDGPRQRVVVVAARRDMVERLALAVRGAGLRPEGIDLSAFAMVRALAEPELPALAGEEAEAAEYVLYLAIGGLTNLAVAQGTTCLFTRASAGGLELLVTELAERRRLTLEHARAWLAHVGLDHPVGDIEGEEDIVHEARTVLVEGVRAHRRRRAQQPRLPPQPGRQRRRAACGAHRTGRRRARLRRRAGGRARPAGHRRRARRHPR